METLLSTSTSLCGVEIEMTRFDTYPGLYISGGVYKFPSNFIFFLIPMCLKSLFSSPKFPSPLPKYYREDDIAFLPFFRLIFFPKAMMFPSPLYDLILFPYTLDINKNLYPWYILLEKYFSSPISCIGHNFPTWLVYNCKKTLFLIWKKITLNP